MAQMTVVESQVLRGAAWLDKTHPGWVWRVDPETLSMMNGERCMLGQSGGRREYLKRYNENGSAWIIHHAFAGGSEVGDAWRNLIRARQLDIDAIPVAEPRRTLRTPQRALAVLAAIAALFVNGR